MRDHQLGRKLAESIEALEKAESRLKRAFTRWEKARAKVKRYDKEIATRLKVEALTQ